LILLRAEGPLFLEERTLLKKRFAGTKDFSGTPITKNNRQKGDSDE
jgi:hypothetical protein